VRPCDQVGPGRCRRGVQQFLDEAAGFEFVQGVDVFVEPGMGELLAVFLAELELGHDFQDVVTLLVRSGPVFLVGAVVVTVLTGLWSFPFFVFSADNRPFAVRCPRRSGAGCRAVRFPPARY
jgi:hypothetical protein